MSDNKQRTFIIEACRARAEQLFGQSGTVETLFREVKKGPLLPAENYPILRISDNGQTRQSDGDTNDSEERILKIRMSAMLDDNWERSSIQEGWTDGVEKVINAFVNGVPVGGGLIRLKYQGDDPFDVVFTSGKTAALWIIDFEAHYFVETNEESDWTE